HRNGQHDVRLYVHSQTPIRPDRIPPNYTRRDTTDVQYIVLPRKYPLPRPISHRSLMSQRGIDRTGGALFQDTGQDGLLHRGFVRREGLTSEQVTRSPIIGICSSWSELNPCNMGLNALASHVKRGIESAGGLGLIYPTISISEPYTRPTSLFLRNLM